MILFIILICFNLFICGGQFRAPGQPMPTVEWPDVWVIDPHKYALGLLLFFSFWFILLVVLIYFLFFMYLFILFYFFNLVEHL